MEARVARYWVRLYSILILLAGLFLVLMLGMIASFGYNGYEFGKPGLDAGVVIVACIALALLASFIAGSVLIWRCKRSGQYFALVVLWVVTVLMIVQVQDITLLAVSLLILAAGGIYLFGFDKDVRALFGKHS